MEKRFYKAISADGHLECPAEWAKYLPAKFKDRAPRMVKVPGGYGWVAENNPLFTNGRTLNGGRRPMKIHVGDYFNEDGSPVAGTGPAVQRLQEMDNDGIEAEVLHPAVQVSRLLEGITERECYVAMIQAYNNWIAQDYCAVAPDRLLGLGVVPISGVEDAIAETKRCKEMGIKGVCLQKFPNGGLTVKPEDDKYWGASIEIGMPVGHHGLRAGAAPVANAEVNADAFAGFLGGGTREDGGHGFPGPVLLLMATGVFDRLPELIFYSAETNAGWMPGALSDLEDRFDRYGHLYGGKLKMRPTEYLKRNTRYSFIDDPVAMRVREFNPLWEDLFWGTDLPHGVTSYPNSRQALDNIFQGVPDTMRHKILVENPCKFWGLDMESPITPTPSHN